jgi:glycosyltransferase involved in cell wall biosynthesis
MTGRTPRPVSRGVPLVVYVVIPAHNEGELIGGCLTSVSVAVDRLLEKVGVLTTVTVVADSCSDSTVEVAGQHDVDVLQVDVHGVGRARDAGVRHAVAGSGPLDPSRVWVAMTDADSTVPPDWLETQVRTASEGADLVIGPVDPDPDGTSAAVLREWWARHQRPDQLHVHGANLGFTAATFLRVGGFAAVTEHEDVAFVRAALQAGSTWVAEGPTVRTSSRTLGRTPGGFAGYLRLLVAELERA